MGGYYRICGVQSWPRQWLKQPDNYAKHTEVQMLDGFGRILGFPPRALQPKEGSAFSRVLPGSLETSRPACEQHGPTHKETLPNRAAKPQKYLGPRNWGFVHGGLVCFALRTSRSGSCRYSAVRQLDICNNRFPKLNLSLVPKRTLETLLSAFRSLIEHSIKQPSRMFKSIRFGLTI